MSRFGESQDPLFRRINTSTGFDRRLAPYDVRQSLAHVSALRELGVLDATEHDELSGALRQVAEEVESERFLVTAEDEDVHMAVERRVTEICGPLGAKLHTARSRNDQVATDLALFVREHAERALELSVELMSVLLERAREHRDWPAPSYTHLQRAQPVYLGHHLLAYFWMLSRDARRFRFAAESCAELPAGSGALAGLNWELDRDGIAAELGFERPTANSLDTVSNRDFALDHLYACAACATHLSRLGSEIVIWSSAEFGFCEPADSFASGSSIMPQKKNPDAAELLRGKAPRVSAGLATLLGAMHALPLAYAKDLQEDKEAVFDATDTVELCLEAAAKMLSGLSFDRERLAAAAGDEMLAATDLADLLVRSGMAFRDAHRQVGALVRTAIESGRPLSGLEREQLGGVPADVYDRFAESLRAGPSGSADAKISAGGSAGARLEDQLEQARRALDQLRG